MIRCVYMYAQNYSPSPAAAVITQAARAQSAGACALLTRSLMTAPAVAVGANRNLSEGLFLSD